MTRLGPLILVSFVLCVTAASLGCEADEFADAPTVHAPARSQGSPARSATQNAPAAGGQQGRSAGPLARGASAGDMPADHPPVGTSGSAKSGSAKSGSAGGPKAPAAPTAGPQGMRPAQFGKVGPLRWTAPSSWKPVKPASRMRLAEYHVSAGQDGAGDAGQPATLSVFYFGQAGGGSIKANIDRWVGQFSTVDGQPKRSTRTVNTMKVHLVDVSGTYKVGAAMGGGQQAADWQLRGAIVESPAGNFFFKMTGPRTTMAGAKAGFETFVKSLHPAS